MLPALAVIILNVSPIERVLLVRQALSGLHPWAFEILLALGGLSLFGIYGFHKSIKKEEKVIKALKGSIIATAREQIYVDAAFINIGERYIARRKKMRFFSLIVAIAATLLFLLVMALAGAPIARSERAKTRPVPAVKKVQQQQVRQVYRQVNLYLPSRFRKSTILVDGQPPAHLKRTPGIMQLYLPSKTAAYSIAVVDSVGHVRCWQQITSGAQQLDVWPCDEPTAGLALK